MFLTRIEKIGDSAALLLTDEMLNLLGIEFGDEVEVSVQDRKLVIRSLNKIERQRMIEKAVDDVFKRRESAYQRLAEGVPE
ncbi:hypothetical protein QUF90_11370 [Desulfococcaceae bacterium HSG9]|nr:hypothetical protein [Desulfococcaceae bacterium HSG9]